MEPLVRRREGIYGVLIYAACRVCEWKGRARLGAGGPYTQPSEVFSMTQEESRAHHQRKHE